MQAGREPVMQAGSTTDAPPSARLAPWQRIAQQLQAEHEQARSRWARTLHDELGGVLTAAKLDVARLCAQPPATAASDAAQRLRHLGGLLDQGIALTRQIIEELRPSMLAHLGLAAALEALVADRVQRDPRLREVEADLQPVGLSEAAALALFRLVQLALDRAAQCCSMRRRGGRPTGLPAPCAQPAPLLALCLQARGPRVVLRVRGEAVGFGRLDAVGRGAVAAVPPGLVALRCRLAGEGGALRLRGGPGQVAEWFAVLPACERPQR